MAATKTVLVTGATDGIGLETAKQLAKAGFSVLVHGRNPKRLETSLHEIRQSVPSANLEPWLADFSSLDQVRKLADSIKISHKTLDVVIHNAGVFMNQYLETQDGIETTFQVNHLAPFLLTLSLKPLIQNSKIINVSSIAHWRGRIQLDDLNMKKNFIGYGAYAASKLCNVLFTNELFRRSRGSALQTFSLHPGVITTKLLKEGFGSTGSRVEEGAKTSVFLATQTIDEQLNGQYFVNCEPSEKSPDAIPSDSSNDLGRKLWEASSKLVNLDWS